MKHYFLILAFSILFFFEPVWGLEVKLENDETTVIETESIFRVDLLLTNQFSHNTEILVKIEPDSFLIPISKSLCMGLSPHENKKLSFYFKSDSKITAGTHAVTMNINENGNVTKIKKLFFVKPKTKVYFSKYVYDNIYTNLLVVNNSNHAVNIEGYEIEPFSEKKVPYKFNNRTANNFFTDKVPIYYEKRKISEITVFCKTYTYFMPSIDDETFLFPINYGFAFANNKNQKSLTFYTKGGGQFSRNQELEFSFSAPFYNGNNDPYLYYDSEAAIFYTYYRFKSISLRLGDSYFVNNPYLYYRYGRGYIAEYDNQKNFKAKIGYVTKNQFYENKEKDILFSAEKLDNPKIYYNSFLESDHYNQNLGLSWEEGSSNKGLKANFQIFNTDFSLKNNHSGLMGTVSFQNDVFSSSFLADYIGNKFRGRTNSESRLVGSIRSKIPKIGLNTSLRASYSCLFPQLDPEVKTFNFGATISKKIGATSNGFTFDYLDYNQEDMERKNYTFYYSFNRAFGMNYYLSLDQGLTYSDLELNDRIETFKSYSRINGTFQKDRWSLNAGLLSQVRFFSESSKQQNSLFFGTAYRYKQSKAFINFSFSNSSFKYMPSINVNYTTKFKFIDITLDYTLTPSFQGFDWRALAKFNVLQYLTFKKPSDVKTIVYDRNTNKPIEHLIFDNKNRKRLEISNGEIISNQSEEELKTILFGSMDVSRKFTKKSYKSHLEKEYIFNIDYRATILGQLDFRPKSGLRESINKLIFNQRAYAVSEDGKYFFGLINSDGSFTIPGLPVGRYKIGITQSKLPASVSLEEKSIVVDYSSQELYPEIIVKY